MEGINFYRDKKILANTVREFVKDEEERKKLVKAKTYYEMELTKKLWRYVLRVVIEYISVDTRFDRVKTHHLILLNHFRHGIINSFSFYLFTSMSKGIEGFKKIWRYVLRVFIEYISLDTRFDSIKTYHFVLLNHFRHGIKKLFPSYRFTSIKKGIEVFKKKPITNLALHEGFLLLFYEYPKT